jgi:GAF domain-containing protein/ActR/RegA family two-component response regulator
MSDPTQQPTAPPGKPRRSRPAAPAENAPQETPAAKKGRPRAASTRIQGLFSDLQREPAQPEAEAGKPPLRPSAGPLSILRPPPAQEAPTATQAPAAETAPPAAAPEQPPQAPSPAAAPEPAAEKIPAPPPAEHPGSAVHLAEYAAMVVAAEDQERPLPPPLSPGPETLTPHPWESLRLGRPVVESGRPNQPALLALGRSLTPAASPAAAADGSVPALLLEVIDNDPQRVWSEDELLLVEQVTDQLTLALENARLFEEARLRAEQLAKLNEIGLGLTSTLDPKPLLKLIMDSAVDILNCEAGSLFLVDARTNELVFEVALGPVAEDLVGRRLPPGTGLAGQAVQTGKAIIANDVKVRKDWSSMTDFQTGYTTQCLMVAPMRIKDRTVGAIEVINKLDGKPFTLADQELLAAFTTQATIAIENARLYTEELRRRQIADALSSIARTISSALDVRHIAEQTLDQLASLIPYRFASIQLLQPEGLSLIAARPGPDTVGLIHAPTLAQQALSSRSERLVQDSAADPQAAELLQRGVRSWIAAPLLAGDALLGLLSVGHDQALAYRPEDMELIRPVAAQIAVAIQNARLFEETQTARDALQISVRYQQSVAQAVAALTERGIAALSEVLELLGQAAQVSRAYYIETQVDARGPYWRLISEWRAPGVPSQLSNPALRRLPVTEIEPWIERLRGQGFNLANASSAPPQEAAYFQATGARTTLQFAVSGRLGIAGGSAAEIPGCIGFDQIDADRRWTAEEIAALQTAASALSSTITREDLFAQVQANLAETEAQYRASARLNAAKNFTDILNVLRQHTVLGNANASYVSLNLFDRPWLQADAALSERPEWLIPIAQWSLQAESASAEQAESGILAAARYPLGRRSPAGTASTLEQLLHPERPTLVMDVANDPRLDEQTRRYYLEQMHARSLLFVPLNVSGRWIGQVIAIYRQMTGFTEPELRRLTSLAGQAAVALEGLRLVEETRQRNEELATINQITAAVSRTLDPSQVLSEILIRVLSAVDYESGLISLVDPRTQRLYLAVHQNLPEGMVIRLTDEGLEGTPCDMVYRSGQLIYQPELAAPLPDLPIPGIQGSELSASLQGPLNAGFNSYLGVPLISKGVTLGTICLFNRQAKPVSDTRLSLLSSVGQQLGVVVENARLFQRTQAALSETEMSYAASAELNRAQTFDEILDTLRKYSVLGQVDYSISLEMFERPWSGPAGELAGAANARALTVARWRAPALGEADAPLPRAYRLRDFPPAGSLLRPDAVVAIPDLTTDPLIDAATRQYYQTQAVQPQHAARGLLLVPLVVGGVWIGFAHAIYTQPIEIHEADLRRLEVLASQAAVSAQNLRQLAQIQEQAQYEHITREIGSQVSSTIEHDAILRLTARALGQALNATHLAIRTQPPRRSPHAVGYPDASGYVYEVKTDRYLTLDDPQARPILELCDRLPASAGQAAVQQAANHLYAPIILRGDLLGSMDALDLDGDTSWDENDLAMLQTISAQVALSLDNARLFQESQRRARQLQTAAEIARDTTSTLALDVLLQRTVSLLCERFGYYHASIYLLDESGKHAVVRGATGEAGAEMVQQEYHLAVGGRSLVGQVTASGEPLLLNDIYTEQAWSIHQPNPRLPHVRSELGLPLKIGDQVIGALEVQSSQPNAFSDDDLAVLQTLADQIAVAVDNARSYELAQKAVQEISEADRLKTQFLANMSHELRTPLNSIIGFSRVILKGIDGPVTEQQAQDLTAIYNSGQHLLGLINDVLDLSKIEAGKMEMALEANVNLADIIRSVMSTTIGLVKDKPIQLHQNLSPNLPSLTVDPMKIRQVLINLLSNAAKFTDQGSITVEAEPHTGPQGEPQVIVRVIDTGPGIAPKDQARLFQPFSQVDGSPTRKTGGTGLGLSICQHLVRMHGGEIGLQSEVGKGTTFYFTLPVAPAGPTEAAGATSQETAPADDQAPTATPTPRSDSANRVVLVIDKDPQLTDIYRRYLVGHDYTVIALTELNQAVTVARSIQPFAITLDVTMRAQPDGPAPEAASLTPGMLLDGWKVLEALKSDPQTRAIPVIVCTMIYQQERAQRLGAADYLLKPILEEDLIQALKRLEP